MIKPKESRKIDRGMTEDVLHMQNQGRHNEKQKRSVERGKLPKMLKSVKMEKEQIL